MKRLLALAIVGLLTGVASAQFVPPPGGLYSFNGTNWIPNTNASAYGILGYTPPPMASYCYNGTAWTPCTIGGGGSGTPPLTYVTLHAAVSSGGSGFSGAFGTYNANAPTIGSVNPATTTDGYMLFAATPSASQYAQTSVVLAPYWTSSPAATGLWINFYSTSTTGNSVMDVQTACVVPGQAIGSPTWSTAIVTTTAAAGTASTDIQTALITGIAAPGANSCPATGMTTPTKLLIRIYADSTSAVPTYVTGAILVYGRSQ